VGKAVKLKVLAETKSIVAVHKPAGFVTYADSKEQIAFAAKERAEHQLKRKLFPVHRIDKDTCGVLVFAPNPLGAKKLTELFRSRAVKKRYLAIVHGLVKERGVINEPLAKHKSKETEPAETEFTRLACAEIEIGGEKRGYSLVRLDPHTGRYHQLRRHLRFIGSPIIGDREHGNSWDNERFLEKFQVKRTLLSAVHLAFPDREAERMVRLSSRPDEDFLRVVEAFGWGEALKSGLR
jgi:tRNA pseudouridine65 synthase